MRERVGGDGVRAERCRSMKFNTGICGVNESLLIFKLLMEI